MTADEIGNLPRSAVRYALFRGRSGNPDKEHQDILDYYKSRLDKYGLILAEVGEHWDISKSNNLDIVSGHTIHLYKEETKSLFNTDGSLKE